ncbi:glycosyltransferase family 39 protein [Candidatus Sumerlaeota bacterium]|nr:glycosyltransferase family 39 protein [Candidatus Sumerlaeota bacterium]
MSVPSLQPAVAKTRNVDVGAPGNGRPLGEWRGIAIRTAILALCAGLFPLLVSLAGEVRWLSDGVVVSVPGRIYHLTRWSTIAAVSIVPAILCVPWARRLVGRFSRTRAFPFLPGIAFLSLLCIGPLRYPGSWGALAVVLLALASVLFLFRRETARMLDGVYRISGAGWIPALGVALLGGIGVWALHLTVFEGREFCVDSTARLFHAHILNQGRWYAPAPAYSDLYSPEGLVVENGRWYSQYFPGGILIALAGLRIGNQMLLPCLMAMGVPFLAYLCGARLFSRRIGLAGALFVIVSPLFLLQSSILMEHTPTTFFLMTALWLGLRDLERPTLLNAVLLGFVFGYGCITRPWTCFGFAFPLLLVYVGLVGRFWRRRWPYWLAALAAWSIPAIFLLYFNVRTTGFALRPGYVAQGSTFHSLGFTARNGHTPLSGLSNELSNVASLSEWLYMWPATSYLFILLLFLVGRVRPKDIVLFSPFAGLLAAYFFYPFHNICLGPRFVAESIPSLALLTARGIAEVIDLARRHTPAHTHPTARRCAVAVLLALTLGSIDPARQWARQFHASAVSGAGLERQLRRVQNDPLATVLFHHSGADNRAAVEKVQSLDGADFLVVEENNHSRIRDYVRENPERHYYVVDGPAFERLIPFDPRESLLTFDPPIPWLPPDLASEK